MNVHSDIFLNALAYLYVLGGGAAFVAALLAIRPRLLPELWTPRLPLTVPWKGADVLLALLLVVAVPGSGRLFLLKTGVFDCWFDDISAGRQALYGTLLDLPLFVGIVLVILQIRNRSHVSLARPGPRRIPQNATLGYAGFALATPLVVGLYSLVLIVMHEAGLQEDKHPIEQLGTDQLLPWEWSLLLFRVAVFASVIEEVVFRGILLRWLEVVTPQSLTVIPICGSALLWAMFHVSVWPTPIPLFVMGLGLGWLAWRTQSVIGPIVWHSLFNTLAFLVLYFKTA